jgi:hypothetical protein
VKPVKFTGANGSTLTVSSLANRHLSKVKKRLGGSNPKLVSEANGRVLKRLVVWVQGTRPTDRIPSITYCTESAARMMAVILENTIVTLSFSQLSAITVMQRIKSVATITAINEA